MDSKDTENRLKPWQRKIHEIIYEADTKAGKLFDVLLIIFILLSVITVMLESVKSIEKSIGPFLSALEWFFTITFTIEYILRIICIEKKSRYVFSFFGIIDLLSILPSYLEIIVGSQSAHYLATIRIMRVLRIFRILKLTPYLKEANILSMAILASTRKVLIFLSSVLVLVTVLGSIMFLIESPYNPGYSSIPKSIYWAIVTITTVGYGDISPITTAGQLVASLVMLTGYAIIAVPTGIISVEISQAYRKSQQQSRTQSCIRCLHDHHDDDARHCKKCGAKLD